MNDTGPDASARRMTQGELEKYLEKPADMLRASHRVSLGGHKAPLVEMNHPITPA